MNRAKKVLVFTLALSYTVYTLYWLIKGVTWFFESTFNGAPHLPPTGINPVSPVSLFVAGLMDYSAFLGLIIRAVGGFFALYAALQLFRVRNSQYSAVKNMVVLMLVCEAVYFLSLVPSIAFLFWFSALSPLSNAFLSTQLAVQVFFIVPCLALVALKLKRNVGDVTVLRWTAVLALSYIFALWLSYQLKWLELFNGAQVYTSTVFGWLIENARLLSFLNTTIIFTFALLFAMLGTRNVFSQKTCKAAKMWSLSAFFMGLFFVFYVLYCSYLGAFWVIPFGEIWLIPLVIGGTYYLLHPLTTTRKETTR